jgi:hypothetical protein
MVPPVLPSSVRAFVDYRIEPRSWSRPKKARRPSNATRRLRVAVVLFVVAFVMQVVLSARVESTGAPSRVGAGG